MKSIIAAIGLLVCVSCATEKSASERMSVDSDVGESAAPRESRSAPVQAGVSFEDDLRAKASAEFGGCDVKLLTVTQLGDTRTLAEVSGCGKKANFTRADGSWSRSP